MNEIYQRLLVINKGSYFTPFEYMIKNCFLPQKKFYDNNNLIFHDNLLVEYKESLLNILYLWLYNLKLEDDVKTINFKNLLKSPNIILLLTSYIKDLNDIDYTLNFLDKVYLIISNAQNAYTIFSCKNIYCELFLINFKYYKSTDIKNKQCFTKSKSILLDIFINALLYMEKNHNINPCSEMHIILIWSKKILEERKDINENKLYEFLSEFFFELLTIFKIKFDPKMIFNLREANFSPKNNYYLKNYFYLMTNLFQFGFFFNNKNNINNTINKNNINSEFDNYINAIRLNKKNENDKISTKWVDFQLFEDLFKRFNIFWGRKSSLQKMFKSKTKLNKILKYEEILNELIIDKDNRLTYNKKFELLFFQESTNTIIPPINIISITLMIILSLSNDEKILNIG